MEQKYNPGDRVRMISNPNIVGVVTRIIGVVGEQYKYEVFLQAGDIQELSENDIILHDVHESDPQTTIRAGRYAPIEAFKSYLTYEKFKYPLSDYLYSFMTARIEFHPHQFRPLIKFVRGIRHRLLIADEVGLGKTIEAGLIYKELKARLPLNRVLIVCPSALKTKWAYEFQTKFREYFQIYDPPEFMEFLDNLEEPDGWNRPLHAIVSLQGIRQKHIIDRLKEVPFNLDMLIIDESHHLRNDATDSYSLAKTLCFYADAVLFLTATPVNLRERDLYNQLRLLAPDEFDDYHSFIARIKPNEYILETSREISRNSSITKCLNTLKKVESTAYRSFFNSHPLYNYVLSELSNVHSLDSNSKVRILRALRELSTIGEIITRTRKREVQFDTIREAQEIRVEWSESEYTFYNNIINFVRNEMIQRGSGGLAVTFAAINLQRMAASCLPATLNYLEDSLKEGRYSFENEIDEDEYDVLEELDSVQFGIDFDIPTQKMTINNLLEYGRQIARDTKFDSFIEMLTKLENSSVEKIIVFSYFLRTISYLKKRLSSHFSVWAIDGRVPIYDRNDIIDAFRYSEKPSILLMSEVGAEGLDFQFCHCMFNYDLPWNPMRLEQRIGRLDRFGQKNSKVLIYNFYIPQTIETRIFSRLYRRIGIFKRSVGDLESILGNEVQRLHKIVLDPSLSDEQRMERSDAISQALEHRKNDQEEYDVSSEELVAQNDLLTQELDRINQEKKYITPSELENFVRWGIQTYFNFSALKFIKGNSGLKIGVLKIKTDLSHAVLEEQPLAETDKDTIYRQRAIIRERPNLKVTMNAELAFENSDLHLIAPDHIIVRAISKKLKKEKHPFWTSTIKLANTDFRKGRYLFVVFRLTHQAKSPASREQFIRTVVVKIKDFTSDSELSETFMAQMEYWSQSDKEWHESAETIDQCIHTARENLEYSQRLQLDERRSSVSGGVKMP